jgi:hypothetical protein
MSMDELSVMDGSKCILQLRGVRPFLSDKFDITAHKNYRYLSDANPKLAFDIGKHLSRRLKLKPTDEYEHFEYVPTDEEMPQEALSDFNSSGEREAVGITEATDIDDMDNFGDFPEDLEPI